MNDVSVMALNRGRVKKGRGTSTLQVMCRAELMYIEKPQHVRVRTCFVSMKGSLFKKVQKYCQMDVKIPLILHFKYRELPDLTLHLNRSTTPVTHTIVDIMPQKRERK